nr:ricin-type beta-trefoil lectin domain protein [uncultured Actinoplanes sp.]
MKDDDFDRDRDPLLVRPYLLHDVGAAETPDEQSTQTWPAAAASDVPAESVPDSAQDSPAVTPPAPPETERRGVRRRLLVLVSIAVVVLVGAGAAAFAALRDDIAPPVSAMPAEPLPAVTGPRPTSARPPASAETQKTATSDQTATTAGGRKTSAATGSPSAPALPTKIGPAVSASASTGSSQTSAPPSTPGSQEGIAPATRTGAIRGQNGVCLDLDDGDPSDDNDIQVFTCNGTAAQTFTLAADGTLRVAGKCALTVGDFSVHIVACDGRTTAKWRTSGQQVINMSNNGCLTDPLGGRRPGTRVLVVPCAGSARQHWSLP